MNSQNFSQKIFPDDPRSGVMFGRYLEMNGKDLFVSAYLDYENGQHSGSLHIFNLIAGRFRQTSKLFPDDGIVEQFFSYSVSSYGDYLITGAHHDSDYGASSGAAYILKKSNDKWDFHQKIAPSELKEADEFGKTVAIYGDIAVAGAWLNDDKGTNTGCVYVLGLSDDIWDVNHKIYPSDPQAYSLFSLGLDIHEDHILAGAPYFTSDRVNSGAAYLFMKGNNAWSEIARFAPEVPDDNDLFGHEVKLTERFAFVSAIRDNEMGENSGAIYVYDRNKEWELSQKITAFDGEAADGFGIAIEANDTVLFAGAYFNNVNGTNSGAVYIYKLEQDNWVFLKKLYPSDGKESDAFGSSLAFNEYGLTVGAYANDDKGFFSGAVYFFRMDDLFENPAEKPEIDEEIIVYPTIFDDFIVVESKDPDQKVLYVLYDINGKILFHGNLKAGYKIIEAGKLPSGMYILQTILPEKNYSFKIIKK
jgi:hypothetical protein